MGAGWGGGGGCRRGHGGGDGVKYGAGWQATLEARAVPLGSLLLVHPRLPRRAFCLPAMAAAGVARGAGWPRCGACTGVRGAWAGRWASERRGAPEMARPDERGRAAARAWQSRGGGGRALARAWDVDRWATPASIASATPLNAPHCHPSPPGTPVRWRRRTRPCGRATGVAWRAASPPHCADTGRPLRPPYGDRRAVPGGHPLDPGSTRAPAAAGPAPAAADDGVHRRR